jgi:hypothetical protein
MGKNIKNMIVQLHNKRLEYLSLMEKSYDEQKMEYGYEPVEIDQLGDEIYSLIKEHQTVLPIEFIIEKLTHLGHAVNILYDDNGHFSVTGDGFQSLPTSDEPCDINMSFAVKKEEWFDTIREALNKYLE